MIYIVEFSLSQKSFHLTNIVEMTTKNIANILKRRQTDFTPIAAFEKEEDASVFIQKTSDSIKDYTMFTDVNGQLVVIEVK